jgi:hypothetical protein
VAWHNCLYAKDVHSIFDAVVVVGFSMWKIATLGGKHYCDWCLSPLIGRLCLLSGIWALVISVKGLVTTFLRGLVWLDSLLRRRNVR